MLGSDISPKDDGTVLYSETKKGDKTRKAEYGSKCVLQIKAKCDDKVFDEREVTFAYADYKTVTRPRGVNLALHDIFEGGEARVKVKGENSLPPAEYARLGLPKDATLEYEIQVKHYDQACSI